MRKDKKRENSRKPERNRGEKTNYLDARKNIKRRRLL